MMLSSWQELSFWLLTSFYTVEKHNVLKTRLKTYDLTRVWFDWNRLAYSSYSCPEIADLECSNWMDLIRTPRREKKVYNQLYTKRPRSQVHTTALWSTMILFQLKEFFLWLWNRLQRYSTQLKALPDCPPSERHCPVFGAIVCPSLTHFTPFASFKISVVAIWEM